MSNDKKDVLLLTKEDFIGMLKEELEFIKEEQERLYDRQFSIRYMLDEDLQDIKNEKA